MHVLLITLRSDMGGGPRHVYDLTRGLKSLEETMQITIASPSRPPFFEKFSAVANQHLYVPHRRFSLYAFLKLLIYCRLHSVDLVHSHGRGAGIYSRMLGLFGVKVVHTFHGAHAESHLKGRLKCLIDRWLSCVNQKFICVSDDERKIVARHGWAKFDDISVIHNGVDQLELANHFYSLTKEQAREHFNLPKDLKIWGTLARLTYQKGIDLIIQSPIVKELHDQGYFFVVAGDGEDREKLVKQINTRSLNNVFLIGEIEEPALFLRCLDGYMSFSRWEGFPVSVLEALALGIPCVISDVDGHRDLRNYCRLFDPGRNDDFALQLTSEGKIDREFPFTTYEMTLKTWGIYNS